MPLRKVPGTSTQYYLICYDENGQERTEDDGTKLSRAVVKRLADKSTPVTDVFFTSHGWQGDVQAAIRQYDAWIGAMVAVKSDVDYVSEQRKNFNPLIVGLHWPSLPFGDEDIPPGDDAASVNKGVELYAGRIADTPEARNALRSILENSNTDAKTGVLPSATKAAYDTLFKEAQLGAGDVEAAPGADQDGWDPQAIVDSDKEHPEQDEPEESSILGGLFSFAKNLALSPLRQASFWAMKRRASIVGETGGHTLLSELQTAASPDVRFHLMGHSFGCIVMSATIMGPVGGAPLPRPVDSLLLVQGALSIWAFASDIPYREGTPGYFYPIVKNGMVKGPIVTTRSEFDGAVGFFYPKGARLKRQLVLVDTPYPKYAGVGSYGIQGAAAVEDLSIKHVDKPYAFKAGRIYNIEASRVISEGKRPVGAHSDIAKPEVAHIFWEAVLSGL